MRRLTRRQILKAGAGLGAATYLGSVLAACGPSATEPPATAAPAAATAAPAAAAKPGGQATLAWMLEPNSLDPAQYEWRASGLISVNVFESLVEKDHDGNFHPRLAESWEMSADGLEITWKLRQGIQFHDGTPFNADAVKFTFDRILKPETGAPTGLALIGPFESSEVIDDYTIKMKFSQPYGPLFSNFSTIVLAIVSPAAAEKYGKEFAQNPVGTGPFKFQSWVKGDRITIVRNENYVNTSELVQHDGPAFLDTFVYRTIPEDDTRLAALKTGEIEYHMSLPNLDVEAMKTDPNFVVTERMFGGAPTMLLINAQLPPTDDLAVRQAVEFAVDREVINRIATAGNSVVAWGPLKPVIPGYNPEVETLYRYDPEKAKQLLEDAGWKVNAATGVREKNGQVGKLITFTMADPIRISFLEAIQGMLRAVGLDLEIQAMSLAASEDLARQGKCSLTFMDWEGTDPDILSIHYHSSNIGGWNMGYFNNPDVDKLLDDGRTEIDPDKRIEIYKKVQMLIMEQAATLTLYHELQIDAYTPKLEGLRFDEMNWTPIWYDVAWKA